MCYAKPGPRCSAHAKADLERATVAREIAHAAANALQDQYWRDAKARVLQPGEKGDDFYRSHPYGIATEKSIAALDALRAAQAAYDATPAGMNDIKAEMAAREEEVGDALLTDDYHAHLASRLARAQQTRRDQLEAHRQTQAQIAAATPVADTGGDDPEAEAAAMAPAPACACIEYRYQGDCAHLSARINKARETLVPTSAEAALHAHALNSRLRTLETEWASAQAALGVDRRTDWEGYVAAREAHPALMELDKAVQETSREARDAESKFYGTPAGIALLNERLDARAACTGYGPHYMGGWEGILQDAQEDRAFNAALFTERTGQSVTTEDAAAVPPDLMYSNGCPTSCKDFKWTGRCAHTDTEWARADAFIGALRGLPEVKKMNKAMERAFTPKRSLLSRLRGGS